MPLRCWAGEITLHPAERPSSGMGQQWRDPPSPVWATLWRKITAAFPSGVDVWWCGGLVVWSSGGVVAWWYGRLVVWELY